MANSHICPVCSATAPVSWQGASFVSCSYCGDYAISVGCESEGDKLSVNPESDRFKLICVLAERRLKGKTGLFIVASHHENPPDGRELATVKELIAEFPRNPSEFFDRALLNLSRSVKYPTDNVKLRDDAARILFSLETESTMITQLEDFGYIRTYKGTQGVCLITGKGWERIEKLQSPGTDSRQAFVAMWFDKGQDAIFENGMKPAIEADGVTRAFRIDLKQHNGKIDDEIVAEIRRSRYMVADFTGNRGGVYFEAGLAAGRGIPVVWCIQKPHLKKVHFDTRQYNFIVYHGAEDLRVKLLNRIRATIV